MGWSALGRIPPLLAVVMLVLLALPALPARAGAVDLGTTLHVEWQPDPLTLRPEERGTVDVAVENIAGEPLRVSLMFTPVKGPGGCRATVSPDYFELGPGATQAVQVSIWTHPEYLQEQGISDCRISIGWGTNLTRDAEGNVLYETADGNGDIAIPIRDDFSSVTLRIVAIVASVVVFLSAVAYLAWRRSRRPQAPMGPIAK